MAPFRVFIGHVNAEPDEDGVYRRVPLLYAWDGGCIPSLPLAVAVKNNRRIKIEKIELKAGEYLSLPLSERDTLFHSGFPLLHNALSRYFPRALSEQIMREWKTELIPAYKEMTILFSDISGFTKWSSDGETIEAYVVSF